MGAWLLQTVKSPEVISVFLTALAAIIANFLRPTARLVWGSSHGFTFLVPNEANQQAPNTPVNTGTVFVQNIGRRSARDVEVVLNFRPQHFQIWPVLNYQTAETPEHHFIIKIQNLGPREYTTVEMLSASVQLPLTLRVRSPLGDAKLVAFAPMRVMPSWFNRGVILLVFAGILTIIYSIVRFISFAASL